MADTFTPAQMREMADKLSPSQWPRDWKLARMLNFAADALDHAPGVCEWQQTKRDRTWHRVSCQGGREQSTYIMDFKFCPYCGRPLKEVPFHDG